MKKENIYVTLSTQRELDILLNVLISHGEKVGGIVIDPHGNDINIGFYDGAWLALRDIKGRENVEDYVSLVKILKKPTYTAAEIANVLMGVSVILMGVLIRQPVLFPVGLISIFSAEIIRQIRLK